MPTYQYSCTECGHFFEQFQSFSEDSLTVCPQCEGRLRKVFNAVGVVFKGSGFYRTDSRSGGEKAENGSGSTSEKKAAATSDSGSSTSSSGTSSTPSSSSSSGSGTTSGSSTSAA